MRVYALIPKFSPAGGDPTWLVVEEYFRGGWIQKFPGGGVEPQEGLEEALERELKEELGVEVHSLRHFYTTHFFQRSYYHSEARLLAIYYLGQLAEEPRPTSPRMKLHWLRADYFQLTFPVDRYVGGLLRQGPPLKFALPLHNELSSTGH